MAKPLSYEPPVPELDDVKADIDRTLRTLHEREVLRFIDGLFANGDPIAQVGAEQMNSESGRRALGNALLLLKVLTAVDPIALQQVAGGASEGISEAAVAVQRRPPGIFGLIKMLLSADTRRGLAVALTLLAALGRGGASAPADTGS